MLVHLAVLGTAGSCNSALKSCLNSAWPNDHTACALIPIETFFSVFEDGNCCGEKPGEQAGFSADGKSDMHTCGGSAFALRGGNLTAAE